MFDYKAKPFYLNDEEIRWVDETWESMTLEEKIGQLFCPIGYSSHPDYLKYEMLSKHPGGILFRTGPAQEMFDTYSFLQKQRTRPNRLKKVLLLFLPTVVWQVVITPMLSNW